MGSVENDAYIKARRVIMEIKGSGFPKYFLKSKETTRDEFISTK